jgi:hypothetical protein
MDLLKKHYEKIILGGVLLILVVSAALLPMMISSERDSLRELSESFINRPAKPLEALNFSTQQVSLQRLQARLTIDLSTSNKVFNPLQWQKAPDGRIFKIQTGEETGPKALEVVKLVPLYLKIGLDSVSVSDSGIRYVIGVEREAAVRVSDRRKTLKYATVNNKNDVFVLREVRGAPESPTELVLELPDTAETVTISKEKPLLRVDGYMADLKYELEKRAWNNQRVGGALKFGNEDYIIVAITKNEVVVSAKSNQKKTQIPVKQ